MVSALASGTRGPGFDRRCKISVPEHAFLIVICSDDIKNSVTSLTGKGDCYIYSPALKKWGLYWICPVILSLSFCLSVIIQMKLEYLWGQLANLDQILYEASLGWGKSCIRFWDRLDQNSGFHGNKNRPLTYNGENDVSTFSLLLFIRSFSNLQVTSTGIKSRTSSNFGQIGPLPTELGALERLKNYP